MRQLISSTLLVVFLTQMCVPPVFAQEATSAARPPLLAMPTPAFSPAVLCGIKIDAKDPFRMEFLVDPGATASVLPAAQHEEFLKLVKYFLAAMAIPDKDMWVNLSPYEKDRIIPDNFGLTLMGRALLSQDYILKEMTSGLMYPDRAPGHDLWSRIYKEAHDKYGTTDIPLDTFNKIWIMPDKAEVYEANGTAIIGARHLKVMLESDLVAMSHQRDMAESPAPAGGVGMSHQRDMAESPAPDVKAVIRAMLLPVLEKEVNEGKNFAPLRQAYQSLILAAWYKRRLKESLLAKVYVDKSRVAGIDAMDKDGKDEVYARYLEVFRKGFYNYVKEEVDPYTREIVPRRYFSGGVDFAASMDKVLVFRPMKYLKNIARAGMLVMAVALSSPDAWARDPGLKKAGSFDGMYPVERVEQLLTAGNWKSLKGADYEEIARYLDGGTRRYTHWEFLERSYVFRFL